MNVRGFRAPAVPLVTHDPFFSLWSNGTNLTDDNTRHWSGVRQYMFGIVVFDGVIYEFMGKVGAVDDRYFAGYRKLQQQSCEVRPMTTIYRFTHPAFDMELKFTSPLLLSDLDILSRPVSYVDYTIIPRDGKEHTAAVQFGFSGEFCVDVTTEAVAIGKTEQSYYFTSGEETMLRSCGDDHRISWGSFHIAAPGYEFQAMSLRAFQLHLQRTCGDKNRFVNPLNSQGPNREQLGPASYALGEFTPVHPYYPTILIKKEYALAGAVRDGFALAYDDVKCLQYFGENIEAYWRRNGQSFAQMLAAAICQKEEVLAKVAAFEENLLEKANKISPKYADIIALAYRQAVAGHKLAYHKGELLFISKENYSNGCAATVDVTYPSIPLFLMYAPQLVEGMLRPIFKLLEKGLWQWEFAPHDAGTYPLLNGQIYGFLPRHLADRPDPRDSQMPIEECGNMLLIVAAVCFAKKDMAFFAEHKAVLKQWADYLVKMGYNPENQLCTDDFAGHLAHNCNLSVKAICALAAYAKLLEAAGESGSFYRAKAEEFAAVWETEAFDGDHYRLTFDQAGSWSIKYNMVWDKLLKLELFSQKVYDLELACYKKQMNAYGLPLDNRGETTKTDWQMWSTRLFDDKAYTDLIVDTMWKYLTETPDRVPFSDCNYTTEPYTRIFIARTVQGGLFINLLELM